jgi:ATP-dependent helicase HrpB
VDTPLPIYDALPAVRAHLDTARTVVLQAPPGAGKSTALPLELLDAPWLAGQRILMLEPRRLAARAVAARMAGTLGESLGGTVGYRVRFENQVSNHTRLEVLTEGILTRRLQGDPGLDGVGLVIFDEFHERSLHADLALALCRDVQSALRDDLRLLIMSATLDLNSGELRSALGDAPVVTASGQQHPVEVIYAARDFDNTSALVDATIAAVSRALAEQDAGDVLAFLPGAAEIRRAQAALEARHPDVLVRPLYGDLSLDAQQAAITPDLRGRRKVVLATSIAETSLTIEGVRAVVDSGLSRVPRFDSRAGLTRLETVRVTRDSADQRAGRAGRLGPGVCYRLWSEATQARLRPTRKPEILEADLAPMRLELAQWGVRDANDLRWATPPPAGAWRQAEDLLRRLDALDGESERLRLTERGRRMADWPTHPRLAHMLIESERLAPALAADLAALLDERDPLPREAGADLTLRVEALRQWRASRGARHSADARVLARIERITAQWRRQFGIAADNTPPDPHHVGRLVTLAYPDRVAQGRGGQLGRYRLSNGRGAQLAEGDPLQREPWLAVAHVDAGRSAAGDHGRIYLAAPVRPSDLEALVSEQDAVGWDARAGALVSRRERRIGELVVSSQPIAAAPTEARAGVLCEVVRKEGLGLLRWSDAARQWQARAQSLHVWRGDDWPDVSDDGLLTKLDMWLAPWLDGISKREDFARLDVLSMLRGLLTHRQQAQLDTLAPTHLAVPSGSSIRLVYSLDGAPPVLAVKLQEIFGLADTPAVNDGRTRVMLHLLSPAQRPIQVTQDLRSFWAKAYPAVRKELRGRYNKHPWPEDPWAAPPTRKTVKSANAQARTRS